VGRAQAEDAATENHRVSRHKICLVTSLHLSYNPRVLKEADALHMAGHQVRVVAMNLEESKARLDESLMAHRSWKLETLNARRHEPGGRLRWLKAALRQHLFQRIRVLEKLPDGLEKAYSRYVVELGRLAAREPADLFIAHLLLALPAADAAARKWKAKLGFDAEDYHRGEIHEDDAHRAFLRRLIMAVEQKYIPRCDYLSAASDGIGGAYASTLGVRQPVTILNVFPLSERNGHTPAEELRKERQGNGLSLYWYSQMIGADRGLDDALQAVSLLSKGVHIHLRGAWAAGYETIFRNKVRAMGIEEQVHILPPAPPEQLVERAAQHDVGLALEAGATENRRVAVTNKILNYLLAGLAVAATDVPGQRAIMAEASGAGVLFKPGDAPVLARELMQWRENPGQLQMAKARSRQWGEEYFCWDKEKEKLIKAVEDALCA